MVDSYGTEWPFDIGQDKVPLNFPRFQDFKTLPTEKKDPFKNSTSVFQMKHDISFVRSGCFKQNGS